MLRTNDGRIGVELEPHEVPVAQLALAAHLNDICLTAIESRQQVLLGSEWMVRFVHTLVSNHIAQLHESLPNG